MRVSISLRLRNLLEILSVAASVALFHPGFLLGQTGNVVVSTNTTWATGTYSITSLTVNGGATLTIGGGSTVTASGAILVTGNSSILVAGAHNTSFTYAGLGGGGTGSTFQAYTLQVDAGSSISGDQQGYIATVGTQTPGVTGTTDGGSYGGPGGGQTWSSAYCSMAAASTMIELASGGASAGGTAGAGGGGVVLSMQNSVTVNGTITANGGSASGAAGGGAGGGVWIEANTVTGSGVISAIGGSNVSGNGSGGGGGCITIYTPGTLSPAIQVSVAGGTASGSGVAGTSGQELFGVSSTSPFLEISKNSVFGSGQTLPPLTVAKGTLTLFGSMTVNGALRVESDTSIICAGINTTAQVNGAWAGQGCTISAGSIEVDAGGSISADTQGYIAQAGPSPGVGGQNTGASYGGAGGGQAAGTVYGSSSMPVDLGSGGGTYQSTGGSGGGAIALAAGGAITNNGTISANGGAVAGNGFGSGGAGGSIYVTAGTLTGSGTFSANGGANPSTYGDGGGGGRVAIYVGSGGFSGFTGTAANGGSSPASGGTGAVGTVAFFDTSAANPNVSVYQNFTLPSGSTTQYNSLTLAKGATMSIGGNSTLSIAQTIQDSGILVAQSTNTAAQVSGVWAGKGVTLNVGSLTVDAGASLNADAQGYTALAGPGAGGSGTSNGGSYGGAGGGQLASTVYGSGLMPADLGSGGGSYESTGGTGGGALRITASGAVTNNGIISANGGTYIVCTGSGACGSGSAGGGAGGSLYVTAGTLTGSGTFNANGGPNASLYGNGGGGGRVVVYSGGSSGYTGFATSTASGGTVPQSRSSIAGATGTVAFIDTSATNGNLSVYQNFVIPAGATQQYNSMTVNSGATVTLGGGSQVSVANALNVTGTITAQSINNSGQINGVWVGQGVQIFAGSVTINANGSIVADSQGYGAQDGPGAGSGGTSDGGSYGGLGGGQAVGTIYGSQTTPLDLGSGGGQYQGTAGSGGGAVQMLVSGSLTNNGLISANGQTIGGSVGAGAGGSIDVAANSIAGSGTFAANGGANSTIYGNGGGGGRIALSYAASSSIAKSQATAAGGTGSASGANGTVQLLNTPVSAWVLPTGSVIHGSSVALEWFTDTGKSTNVALAGPQTATIATGTGPFSNVTFDSTQYPDGAYQLLLTVLDISGQTLQQVVKAVVINNSVTWHSGTLTSSQTWLASAVQALDGNVIVPAGVTLTIQPGTIVKALAGAQIIVQPGGTLIATGTTGLPVTFTTFDDYTLGGNTDFNQGVSLPDPGEWSGINVASGGTFSSNSNTIFKYSNTALSGTLGANTTLYSTQDYTVTGTLTVPKGITLNVLPGAVVKFAAGAGLSVQAGATFTANGTLAQPIYFTSVNDSSIGGSANGSATAPAPGDWNSMVFDGSTVSLQHVQVQYGGGPVVTNAQVGMIETTDNANVTISDSVLANSFFMGLQTGYPNNGGDTVTVTDTVFYGIEGRGINTYPGSTVHIVNDTFDGNASGVFNHGGTVDVENSVVSNSVNTTDGGIGLCCGGTFSALAYNDVYSKVQGAAANYTGLTDPTGTNGNISAVPVYMDTAVHDYRPTYGSPLIDAASGTVSNYPLTDAFGLARFNDPLVTTRTGVADINGNYPDIGAFEFVQSAPSNLDLTASEVQGPATALTGTQVTVNWTVTNIGTGTVYGPWHDGVYLVTDPNTNPVSTLAGVFLEGQGVTLGPGGSYNATATVTVPGVTIGSHRWEVKTNVLGEIFEGANTANNTGVSLNPVETDLPQIVPGATPLTGSFAGTGQSSYYKVVPSATQSIQVQLALNSGLTGAVQLFVGAGYVPSPQQYDFEQIQYDSTSASVVIPSGTAQTYYIMAYAQSLPVSPAGFSISASTLQFSLTQVTPSTAITSGTATLTFIGGGFSSGTTFLLAGAGGKTYSPTSTFIEDSSHAAVTFNMTSIPVGTFTAEAINTTTVSLANALTTSVGQYGGIYSSKGDSALQVTLETPQEFRAGFPSVVTLNYVNSGSVDMIAPMIYLSASNATLAELPAECGGCSASLSGQVGQTFTSGMVLGISHTGPAGVLPAGAAGSIQFLATPTSANTASFSVATQALDIVKTMLIPQIPQGNGNLPAPLPTQEGSYATASSFCSSLTPPGADPNGFTRACGQMLANAGYTYTPYPCTGSCAAFSAVNGLLLFTGFQNLLAADATALSAVGDYEYDVQKLLDYEFQKDGIEQFNQVYHQGALGFGPSLTYDIVAYPFNGTMLVKYPDGSERNFAVTPAGSAGTLLSVPGDYGAVVMQTDGSYLLTEPTGEAYHFPATYPAPLDYIQDRNGNKTQLTYSGGNLSTVTDALGNTLTFQFDLNGHLSKYTDEVGRTTTFTYTAVSYNRNGSYGAGIIATGYFLASKTDATGITSYTWNTGGPYYPGYVDDSCIATFCNTSIGLTSAAYPDGTHTNFTYDTAGRLTGRSRDLGVDALNYTYNASGTVTVTDATGKAYVVSPDAVGNPLSTVDALGNPLKSSYDPEGKLTSITGPRGDVTQFSYDSNGNPAGLQKANGGLTSLAYGPTKSLQSATDPNGNVTSYSYDSHYNLTAVTAPTGKSAQRTYDSYGRPTSMTNMRGHTTSFTYGANGLMASKTFANGTVYTYGYDAHKNLISSATAAGPTTYSYDSADRLTQVANPNGTWIRYAYNAGGQHISTSDSTGHTQQYTYDAAGRVANVKDGNGATLVTYGYDAASHVVSKTLGNGTSAATTYNADGQISAVINKSASNSVSNQYSYTYDAAGNAMTIGEPAGTQSIGYDVNGTATSVAGAASAITYTSDAVGNRTAETNNGANVSISANNLNETTSFGSNVNQYDADGNCTACNGMSYTYDDENHVTSVTDTGGNTTSYNQDALGNIASAINSVGITNIISDLANASQSYSSVSASQTTQNNFVGLAAGAGAAVGEDLINTLQTGATNSNNYYQFDGQGNTVQTTGNTGAVTGSASYTPYGDQSLTATVLPVPYTYQGQSGVNALAPNVYSTPNGQVYDGQTGATQQVSPLAAPGTAGPYTNQPAPGLLNSQPLDSAQFSFSAGVMVGVSVNLHTGDIYWTTGGSTGVGPSVSVSRVNDTTTTGDARGAMVDSVMNGVSVNAGAATGVTATPSGDSTTDFTVGGREVSASAGYTFNLSKKIESNIIGRGAGAVARGLWYLQDALTFGLLFNDRNQNVLNPNHPLPSRCPGCGSPPAPVCGGCLFKPGNQTNVPVGKDKDPNGKITSGFGDQGYVPVGTPIVYTIFFENQPTATLPARIVTVTDPLSSSLNWSTVQLQQVAFNNVTLNTPAVQSYSTQTSVSTDPDPVAVNVSLNPVSGVLTWTIQSVDPVTGSTPANPLAGFLPPNNSANAGTGYVTFSVMPAAGLAGGTAISNQASIVFDVNAAIATNTVTNTIDASTVSSSVNTLSATTASTSIPVSWTGSDPSGSGIASYNIYVEIDGGTPILWLSATTLTSSIYTAIPNHSYTFFSIATNNVGITQGAAVSPQTISVAAILPTITVTPSSSTIAAGQGLSVTITAASTYATPSGSVVLSSGTYTSASTTLTSGAATIVIPAATLPTEIDTLTATYTPDSSSAYVFSSATGTAQVTVGTLTPVVSLSPSSLTFTANSGTTTTAQTVKLSNTGNATLLLNTISFTGTGAAVFAQTNNCGTSLAATTSCMISVTFSPASATIYTATLSIADNATGTPHTVALTGTGTMPPAPAVTLSLASLTFSSNTGVSSASQTVQMTNSGNALLSISGITLSGNGAAAFAQTNTCGTSLAAGASCTVSVIFTPASATSYSASLSIADNAAGTPQTVSLTGTGTTPPAPVVSLSLSSLTFTATAGQTSAAQTVQLSNTGNATLSLTGITITGSGATSFTQTNTCGTSVAAGAACVISVTFSPASAASYNATVSIANNAAGTPQAVTLTGTGTAVPTFQLTVTPATQSVFAGTTTTYAVHVAPQGGAFTGVVSFGIAGLPLGSTATFSPTSVTPGSSGADSSLSIVTPVTFARRDDPARFPTEPVFALAGLLFVALRRQRRRLAIYMLLLVSLAGASLLTGCGIASHSSSYSMTITASSGSQSQSSTVTLTLHN